MFLRYLVETKGSINVGTLISVLIILNFKIYLPANEAKCKA